MDETVIETVIDVNDSFSLHGFVKSEVVRTEVVKTEVIEPEEGNPNPLTSFTEFDDASFDSDLEDDSEGIPEWPRNVAPIHRQPLIIGEEEEEDEQETFAEGTDWREGISTPNSIQFTGKSGLQVDVNDDANPMEYLRLMIDDTMMKSIVTETNRYAATTLQDKELSPHSRFRKWAPVDVPEMWAFFGLIVAMGIIVIQDIEDYWSIDALFCLPFFRAVMKRDRFCLILSFLHICDNALFLPWTDPNHDPLFKIRNFVNKLTENFKRVFVPGSKIAVDEAMVAWRGRLSFRVFDANKPEKFGIKVYELCDSGNGYCSNLEFFTGKRESSQYGAAFDVVKRLSADYLGCGRTLYVDSCYTSPDLFMHLLDNSTLACGTMRLRVRNGPPKRMVPKLKRTSPRSVLTNGTLNLIRFYDNREVNVLTTAHDDAMVATGKVNPVTKEDIVKMKAVHDYNRFMGAVDRSDQMVANNAFKRRTLKWWKKSFFHLFMLGVLNAFIVHKTNASKKLTHSAFRIILAKQMVQLTPIPPCLSAIKAVEVGDSIVYRLTARHFIRVIQPRETSKKKNVQRDCVVCSEPGKRMKSRYECPACNVGLHIACFEVFHTNEDYKHAPKRKLPPE